MNSDYKLILVALVQGILFWPAFEFGFVSVTRKYNVSGKPKSMRDFMHTLLAMLIGFIMLALVLLLPLFIIVSIPLQERLFSWPTYGITLLIGWAIYRIGQYVFRTREQ